MEDREKNFLFYQFDSWGFQLSRIEKLWPFPVSAGESSIIRGFVANNTYPVIVILESNGHFVHQSLFKADKYTLCLIAVSPKVF